jgi:hypothetical protein
MSSHLANGEETLRGLSSSYNWVAAPFANDCCITRVERCEGLCIATPKSSKIRFKRMEIGKYPLVNEHTEKRPGCCRRLVFLNSVITDSRPLSNSQSYCRSHVECAKHVEQCFCGTWHFFLPDDSFAIRVPYPKNDVRSAQVCRNTHMYSTHKVDFFGEKKWPRKWCKSYILHLTPNIWDPTLWIHRSNILHQDF